MGLLVHLQRGENQENENPDTDEELEQCLLDVNYALAKGVSLGAYGAYVDFDEEVSGTGNGDALDAWLVGTGIKIAF